MMILDSAVGGAFMNKLVEESIIILEVVASNYSQLMWGERENTSGKVWGE